MIPLKAGNGPFDQFPIAEAETEDGGTEDEDEVEVAMEVAMSSSQVSQSLLPPSSHLTAALATTVVYDHFNGLR